MKHPCPLHRLLSRWSPTFLFPNHDMYSFFRPTTSPYVMAVRLKGHSAAIFSLAFSPCGNLLASGGRQPTVHDRISLTTHHTGGGGVMIWNLESKQQLPSPPQSIMLRGPITCVNWITQRDDPYNTLCYGTGLGYFVVWRQVSREVSQIILMLTPIN